MGMLHATIIFPYSGTRLGGFGSNPNAQQFDNEWIGMAGFIGTHYKRARKKHLLFVQGCES